MPKLRIATAQFPVAASVARNLNYMLELTQRAKAQKAHVVHFSETCLGGYAGAEFKSWDGYDWPALKRAEEKLRQLAKKQRIGIIYGTNHRLSSSDIRNALVYISAMGKRVARYDKRFCTRGDLNFYKHRTGLMLNEMDSKDQFYDASATYRERAMAGILHSE